MYLMYVDESGDCGSVAEGSPTRYFILSGLVLHELRWKDITIINVVVDKQNKPTTTDFFELAWRTLLQRFENTIRLRNFPGPSNPDEKGQLFPDGVDNKKLRLLVRKMRRYNPIPHNKNTHGDGYRMLPLDKIIEDPNFRNSADSYLIQVVDTAAYFLKQHEEPSQWMKKKGGHLYFKRLESVLCKHATAKDPLGIVRI